MIIGLTGLLGAGKGTVAEYLKAKGYQYYSLSDEIREELSSRGKKITLQNLIDVGNEIRVKFGAGELAKRIMVKINKNPNQDYLVDSIRNPEEIKELQKHPRFILLAVTAPLKIRYQRIQKRKRADDNISFEDFKKAEEVQLKGEATGQQLLKCIKKADFEIINDKDINFLTQKIEEIFYKINES